MDINNPAFVHELIKLVKEQRCLYAPKDSNYRDQQKKAKTWKEIGEKLNLPAIKCKAKWKALRDQFVRETKRLHSIGSESDAARWKYYNFLTFLSDSLFLQRSRIRGESIKSDYNYKSEKEESRFEFEEEQLTCDTDQIIETESSCIDNAEVISNPAKESNLHEITVIDDPFKCTSSNEIRDRNTQVLRKEDEIDTFFKSVTMKIKNANFQPVDLIDLQIEILQVISNKLRYSGQGQESATGNTQY